MSKPDDAWTLEEVRAGFKKSPKKITIIIPSPFPEPAPPSIPFYSVEREGSSKDEEPIMDALGRASVGYFKHNARTLRTSKSKSR